MGRASALKLAKKTELKIDLGCGKNPREGFIGVDVRDFGQDIQADLTKRWPWKDGSVTEAHASHFLEHLTAPDRVHFFNELWRVLIPEGKASIITPYWASCRAYGDMTHQWPPVSEFFYYYLSKPWRLGVVCADCKKKPTKGCKACVPANAPHNDEYTCDFEAVWGYSVHPSLQSRNQDYQNHAVAYFKEAAQDLFANLTKMTR